MKYKSQARENGIVLALPRGGVPVAFEVARRFGVALDVFVVRKLGAPGYPELAMGALASGGVRVLQRDVIEALDIPEREIERVAADEQIELARREAAYRGQHSALEVAVLRHASSSENGDLFWALRGGGGNFGVVTAMEFDLYPVATVYGGNLIYPGELARDALRFYREWLARLPDELSSWMAISRFPALPQVREALRGKTLVLLVGAFAGTGAEGQRWIRPGSIGTRPSTTPFVSCPFRRSARSAPI